MFQDQRQRQMLMLSGLQKKLSCFETFVRIMSSSISTNIERYYVQDLHSMDTMEERIDERIARKFHLLHTKQACVQLEDLKLLINADTMVPQGTSPEDGAGSRSRDHSMPRRCRAYAGAVRREKSCKLPLQLLPRCSSSDCQNSQSPRSEWLLKPQMAETRHVLTALQKMWKMCSWPCIDL